MLNSGKAESLVFGPGPRNAHRSILPKYMIQLNDEKGVCNITSVYSPEYVRRRVLKTPLDTLRVGVSE